MNQKKMHYSFFFSPSTVNLNKVQGIEVKKKKKFKLRGYWKGILELVVVEEGRHILKKNKQIVANI